MYILRKKGKNLPYVINQQGNRHEVETARNQSTLLALDLFRGHPEDWKVERIVQCGADS